VFVVIVAIAASLAHQLLASSSPAAASAGDLAPTERRAERGGAVPATAWPAFGQAAVQIGRSRIHAGPNQHAAPIAAVDQLRVVDEAMRLPVFASIVATSSATLPVAGTVHNTDTLLGRNGFVGVKTGSDKAGLLAAESIVDAIAGHRAAYGAPHPVPPPGALPRTRARAATGAGAATTEGRNR